MDNCKSTMSAPSQGKSKSSVCRLAALLTLLASTLLLLLLAQTETWPKAAAMMNKVALAEPPPPISCLQGVVTTVPGGRLGNLAMEYATAAAVARRYGLRFAASDSMLRHLSGVFHGLTAAPLAGLLRQPPCNRFNFSEADFLDDEAFQHAPQTALQDNVEWAQRNRLPLVLRFALLAYM